MVSVCDEQYRFVKLEFIAESTHLLHGFAGYFDTNLYEEDVILSIHPNTHTPNMFSWFPIYFPLITPIAVSEGERITLNVWR